MLVLFIYIFIYFTFCILHDITVNASALHHHELSWTSLHPSVTWCIFVYFHLVTQLRLCICYFVAKPLRHVCGWPPDLCFHLSVRCSQPSCSSLAGGTETERALVWCDGWSGAQELSSALFSAGFLQPLFLHQTDKPQPTKPHCQLTGWGNAWYGGWMGWTWRFSETYG